MDSVENQASKDDPKASEPPELERQSPAPRDPWTMPPPAFPATRFHVPPLFKERGDRAYGMTAQFSMRATMLLVALAAVCLSIMRSVGAPAELSGTILLVMISAAVAQVFLFRGKDPRRASVVGGAISYSLLLTAVQIAAEGHRLTFGLGFRDVILGLVGGSIAGAIVGYMTGALVAGVFLLIDRYDEWRPKKAPPAANIDPWTDD